MDIKISFDSPALEKQIKQLRSEIMATLTEYKAAVDEFVAAYKTERTEILDKFSSLESALSEALAAANVPDESVAELTAMTTELRELVATETPMDVVEPPTGNSSEVPAEITEPTTEEPVVEAPASPEQPPDTVDSDVENTPL
jgi:hypothetical protein